MMIGQILVYHFSWRCCICAKCLFLVRGSRKKQSRGIFIKIQFKSIIRHQQTQTNLSPLTTKYNPLYTMVQLEEVEDEELDAPQVGEQAFNDDDDFTDTGSSLCLHLPHLPFSPRVFHPYPRPNIPNQHPRNITHPSPSPLPSTPFPLHPIHHPTPTNNFPPPPPLDSEISSDDDLNPTHSESLTDRISALRDILPPSTRQRIATTFTTTKSYVIGGLYLTGKAGWILCTSAMLIGVPFGLAWMEEQQVVEMEKEQKMREMGNEVRYNFFQEKKPARVVFGFGVDKGGLAW